MAVTLRLPPQGHCQTSTAQTLAWSEAQSSLGRFGFSGRAPVAAATGGDSGVGITVARAAACDESSGNSGCSAAGGGLLGLLALLGLAYRRRA